MTYVNHLKGIEANNLFHAVAYGKHLAAGHLAKSIVTGSSGSHVITLQQMLGRGPWNACKGLWWNGVEVPSTDYIFRPGTQSTGMADATQGQSAVFSTDTPHSGVAWMEAELASGMGDFDTKNSPPTGLKGIFETMKIDNYNSSGSSTGNAYSANPALEVADLIIRMGQIPSTRIDWATWVDWRDYCDALISYDYTTLGIDGFGLTGSYYNGTNFNTFVTSRIDPVLWFVSSSGSPAIGVDADNFSVRWEGKIKPKYTQTYTFYVTHDNGAKLTVNGSVLVNQFATDGSTAPGTHSGTIALTAGQYYDIVLDWNEASVTSELKFEWESSSQTREVVSHRALYPKTASRPRWETHPFFSGPTRLDNAVKTILDLCNSVMQEVDGKLRFFCLDQLTTSSFTFTNDMIVDGTLKLLPRDATTLRNSWQARFRDVDSAYLEYPIDPIVIERESLITTAGRTISGEAIEMYNSTMHQGYRLLSAWVKRQVDSKYGAQFTGMPDTFPVLAGDRVKLNVEFLGWTNKEMLVLESNDDSSEETADERPFTLQEWTL